MCWRGCATSWATGSCVAACWRWPRRCARRGWSTRPCSPPWSRGSVSAAAFVGVIAAFQGAGSVAGGFVVAVLIRRYGEHRAAAVGFGLSAAGLALVIPATEVTMCASGVLVGLSIPIFMVATTTLVQRRTTSGMQGRALTAMDAIIDLPFVLSMGIGALVVGFLDFRVIYAAAAVIFAMVTASVLVGRGWRIDAILAKVD
ncbi:MFS transporter [Nonomuraea ferruginea]